MRGVSNARNTASARLAGVPVLEAIRTRQKCATAACGCGWWKSRTAAPPGWRAGRVIARVHRTGRSADHGHRSARCPARTHGDPAARPRAPRPRPRFRVPCRHPGLLQGTLHARDCELVRTPPAASSPPSSTASPRSRSRASVAMRPPAAGPPPRSARPTTTPRREQVVAFVRDQGSEDRGSRGCGHSHLPPSHVRTLLPPRRPSAAPRRGFKIALRTPRSATA